MFIKGLSVTGIICLKWSEEIESAVTSRLNNSEKLWDLESWQSVSNVILEISYIQIYIGLSNVRDKKEKRIKLTSNLRDFSYQILHTTLHFWFSVQLQRSDSLSVLRDRSITLPGLPSYSWVVAMEINFISCPPVSKNGNLKACMLLSQRFP